MFNKKHYKALAKIVHDLKKEAFYTPEKGLYKKINEQDLINAMSDTFAEDNPRFNKQKFIDACN
jgi:hypothetical protein